MVGVHEKRSLQVVPKTRVDCVGRSRSLLETGFAGVDVSQPGVDQGGARGMDVGRIPQTWEPYFALKGAHMHL